MKHAITPPDSYELLILSGLQRKPMYAGTVTYAEVERRRRRNKAARRSRGINRRKRPVIRDLPSVHQLSVAADTTPTEKLPRVIDGELDVTTEIPLVRLLPPVPAPAEAEELPPVEDVDVWGYGWLFGLLFAVVLVLGYPLGHLLFAWSQR